MVHLGGGVAGVLVYKPMQAWVVDDDIRAECIRRGGTPRLQGRRHQILQGVQFDRWAVARIHDGVQVRAWHANWDR